MDVLTPKFRKAHKDFMLHFGYAPKIPNNIDFNQDEYATVLNKSVADNFDYTVEKYGTVIPQYGPLPELIYD